MFEYAKNKRIELGARIHHFNKFLDQNSHPKSIFSSSQQKRKKIQKNLKQMTSYKPNPDILFKTQNIIRNPSIHEQIEAYRPYNTNFQQNPGELSVSFKFSESNFPNLQTENMISYTNKQYQQKQLQKQFYELKETRKIEKNIPQYSKQILQSSQESKKNTVSQIEQRIDLPKKQDQQLQQQIQYANQQLIQKAVQQIKLQTVQLKPIEVLKKESQVSNQKQKKISQVRIYPQKQQQKKQQIISNESQRLLTLTQSMINIINSPESKQQHHVTNEQIIKQKQQMKSQEQKSINLQNIVKSQQNEQPIPKNQLKNYKIQQKQQVLINNSSQGIFFTSDFKEYLSEKKQQAQFIEKNKQLTSPKQQADRLKSSFSLKQSKQSFDMSLFDQVFNEKIKNELVIQIEDLNINNLRKQMFEKRLKSMVESYSQIAVKSNINEISTFLKKFSKIIKFQRKVHYKNLYEYFLHFKLFRQYKFQKTKNKLKIQKFKQKSQDKLIKYTFFAFKQISKAHRKWVEMFQYQSNKKFLTLLFKNWKMYSFEVKIKKQVDSFRLSNLLYAWKKVTHQLVHKKQKKCIKFYYINTLRKAFNNFRQGVQNHQLIKEKNELAENFYYERKLRLFFDHWKEITQDLVNQKNNNEFIPIEYTVRNQLTNTGTNPLTKTREVTINVLKKK